MAQTLANLHQHANAAVMDGKIYQLKRRRWTEAANYCKRRVCACLQPALCGCPASRSLSASSPVSMVQRWPLCSNPLNDTVQQLQPMEYSALGLQHAIVRASQHQPRHWLDLGCFPSYSYTMPSLSTSFHYLRLSSPIFSTHFPSTHPIMAGERRRNKHPSATIHPIYCPPLYSISATSLLASSPKCSF